ncbi:ABC transporter ATP-binding protein [Natrononativus amylolyticus]|uniref:ABC transporter ATP-binding protein n=1 Tax=Natrononativus amylolyticus TaxID=2963434 RepID=UPI0020CCF3C5|nr:oligopeptide/dipeptide ABC transporter ATP-binding protein [Natrononativus amylolyticus]
MTQSNGHRQKHEQEQEQVSHHSTVDETPLVSVRGLTKHYPITEGIIKTEVGRVRAVDGIDFDVYPGETLGIVGESGCGKSTVATTLLQLEEPTDGVINFDGDDIASYDSDDLKRFRRRAQMIFQDPDSSFDPRMSIGESVGEPLRVQGMSDRDRRRSIVKDLLERVGLSGGDIDRYPHEFSGGQKQRIGLARALSVNPDLIVADEPVSALDVSVQSDILALINELQTSFGQSIIFISHDMSVVRQICDRVAVMYLGEIVEIGPTDQIFTDPQHPYTRALIASIPTPDPTDRGLGGELSGDVPSPSSPPSGCRFHTRCPEVIQPDEYSFDQSVWRGILNLRQRLSEGRISPDTYAAEVVAENDQYTDPQQVSKDELRRRIRKDFGLLEPIADQQAKSILEAALEHVISGNLDGATTLLADELSTPCERREPTLEPTDAGHPAACLRHELETESISAYTQSARE